MKSNRFVAIFFLILSSIYLLPPDAFAYYMRALIPLGKGHSLPGYIFLPQHKIRGPLPAVVAGVGVGATKIYQYHDHCQNLANRDFAVILIDPSNYPEDLAPGPWTWDHGAGYLLGSFNQGFVGAKLAVGKEWYLKSFEAAINYMCSWPIVDPGKIALSGFSQAANAVLSVATADPRVKAVVWNYGGWPWIMPYEPYKLPPVEIFHGEKDDVYNVKYAKELAWNLKTNMRPFELNIYPCQGHMFNIVYDLKTENRYMKPALLDAFERMVAFLKRTLEIREGSHAGERRALR
jgi:dienelactone hydrolase